MLELELLIAHAIYSNKGVYALLLGSGISRSAAIPTGWEILQKLISRVAVLKDGESPEDPEKWYSTNYRVLPNYSEVIEKLSLTSEERVNLLKPYFEATPDEFADGLKQSTLAHRSIARLVQMGYVKVIITTNFDRLLENSLRELGIEATVISNPDQVENVMPLIHSPLTIIKINGDYLETRFLNIESELDEYDPRIGELLKFVFENFGLITAGWSAKWDTGLKRMIESSNKFRFSSFFAYQGNCDEQLRQLVICRRGKGVAIKTADHFFHELVENVMALESSERNPPFSKAIALARLKKYVTKDELRIALFELIQQEAEDVFKSIFEQPLQSPDLNAVKGCIEFRINKLNKLCSLICLGVYWGKPEHHEVWLKTLIKFAHPIRPNTSWAIWTNLIYLPALFLFYCMGLSALYRSDFLLLKRLFGLQVFDSYRQADKESIMTHINTTAVIEPGQLNKVYGTNFHVPMCELLYKAIKPDFEQPLYLGSTKEFDDLFDRFELLISLQNIKIFGNSWFPIGRFKYTRRDGKNAIFTRFEELKAQKEKFDWVANDLFESEIKLLEHYTYFNERMRHESYL